MTSLLLIDAGGVLYTNVRESSPFFAEVSQYAQIDATCLVDLYEREEYTFETNQTDVPVIMQNILRACHASEHCLDDLSWIDTLYLQNVAPSPEMFALVKEIRGRIPTA